jgi:hypothetical protein
MGWRGGITPASFGQSRIEVLGWGLEAMEAGFSVTCNTGWVSCAGIVAIGR